MRKDQLHLLTFIAITVIFLIVASFSVKHFIMESSDQLITIQLESSTREADEMAQLIFTQLTSGVELKVIRENVQSAINDTDEMTSFISVMDWSGKLICHPKMTKVGEKVNSNQNILDAFEKEDRTDQLYDILVSQKKDDELTHQSEVVHISPVKESDLLVAANFNLDKITIQTQQLKNRYYRILLLMGGFIVLLSFFAVRILGGLYEKQLESKNSALESELFNLSKLNTDLIAHQQQIIAEQTSQPQTEETTAKADKQRILTYIRNELVPISIDQIAYAQTENSITYIFRIDGKRSTSNLSLDELYQSLDASLFFRANRQFIISISAIEKIVRYGNSQLKILIIGNDNVEIIISKNRAAEFRQWLSI
ncbi:LytR/AlgR family response regulator transcription factor [Aquimarina spongiae]|uniref:Transcriptional regulator, LytTR family n=1 Tax=Aquimarina spongiae TaxID=570521 RepID=A0A1M6J2X5_9FLAO|nr:LytTR family DNA-binding domain-containing protein [Aquimarina spongiae]SHJ41074.1 transcriptional regulator, LytTR family [Aquimarina spongiae]